MTTPSRVLQQPAGVAGAAPRVLNVVDDEPLAKVFARTLEAADYEVRWARDDAKRVLQSETFAGSQRLRRQACRFRAVGGRGQRAGIVLACAERASAAGGENGR